MVEIHEGVDTRGAQPDHARRATLARLAGLCGLALSGEALAALADGKVKAKGKQAAAPKFLSREELALTGVLAEMIIPRTDTPGALAVGAHHTIDHLLAVTGRESSQQGYKAGLARFEEVVKGATGKRFAALPPARRTALLRAVDEGATPFTEADRQFFRSLKQYTLFAYYTSEAGATRELAYLPVPGGYKGDVRVSKATRAWALI